MDVLEGMPVSRHARPIRWVFRVWAAIVLGFLYLPIAFLIMFSFEDSKTIGLPWTGFSTRWYEGLPQNTQLLQALGNSVEVAIAVAVLATIIGTMAAFPLVRSGLRFPNAVRILVTMPIMLPGILIGIALLIFLTAAFGLQLSLLTVVMGHLVFTTPYVVLIVAARLQGFDTALEWAAADLGASPARTLREIVLPLISPAIMAGALIAVTLSIDEFIVTFFLIGPQLTLPIYIYTQIKVGVTPEVNAVATVLLVATLAAFGLGGLAYSQGRRLLRLRRRTP
jgi:spermidine/putrescine transport system permease protein